jgi:hypothetical protein
MTKHGGGSKREAVDPPGHRLTLRHPESNSWPVMTIADIEKRLEGGFVPFTLRTSDGEKFAVPHREFIFVTSKRVVIADRRGYVNVLDPLHIVSIEESRSLPTTK